ncbi:MAG: putative lipid II flippase FtsW [Thermodesulfobacteriota bacterium]
MDEARRTDWIVLGTALLLTGVGLVLVYSTSSPLAFGREGADPASYLKRSLAYAAVGVTGALVAARIPAPWLRRLAYPALGLATVLLVLPWVPPVGQAINGAHRWVRLGPLGFQPSELAKLALVLFLAHSLAKRGERVRSFGYGYLPHVVLPAVPIGLVLIGPDLGTAVLLAAVVAVTAFAGGVRLRHLAAGLLPVLPLVAYLLWFVPFRRDRILAFLDPWSHAQGAGFQLVQSLLAFGAGGVWGVGLGAGRQKLHYLPEAHTDFILSVWAEERGLVGVALVLALVAVLVWRGYVIAWRQEDPFRRHLATGISTWLGLQAALNALVVTGCLPTKGLPFPFLSYGGTGLVVCLTAAGLLAGLARREAPA